MKTEDRCACPRCGNEFSEAVEFCPVCMFRKALAGRAESSESSAADTVVYISEQMTRPIRALRADDRRRRKTGRVGPRRDRAELGSNVSIPPRQGSLPERR